MFFKNKPEAGDGRVLGMLRKILRMLLVNGSACGDDGNGDGGDEDCNENDDGDDRPMTGGLQLFISSCANETESLCYRCRRKQTPGSPTGPDSADNLDK